jgi:alpha/beta superfamily hydrolase
LPALLYCYPGWHTALGGLGRNQGSRRQTSLSHRLLVKVSGAANLIEIRSGVELPSVREEITLLTSDDLCLVGELATPVSAQPKATLITLHPLPTAGGFMDSHILRKAANRLPALADLAVLRFNTRGTESPRGKSEGAFGEGVTEQHDVEAAVKFAESRGLPNLWLVGWSFGTELALKYGTDKNILGVILLSPPLHRTSEAELQAWANSGKRVIALVPELDDYLVPVEAQQRFKPIPHIELVAVDGAKHLWVGEAATKRVLDELVKAVNPAAYPLPEFFAN